MRHLRKIVWALWLPLSTVAGWEILSSVGILDPLFFPPPSDICRVALEMTLNGQIGAALRSTLGNMLLGYMIGCSTGLLCGLAMGRFERLRKSLETPLAALYSTPKLSLFPLLLLLLGVNDAPRILITAIACFIVMAFHGEDAVRAVDRTYAEVATLYGAGGMTLLRKVHLPAAMPTLFTGFRLAVGRAMVVAISVEMVSSNEGLGGLIWLSWQSFAVEKLFVGVALAGLMGALFHVSLRWAEKVAIPSRTTTTS